MGGGYNLLVEEGELDALVFEAECAGARQALSAGDPAAACRLLVTALARWRGSALAEVADTAWARPEAVRLEELRLSAVESYHEALMAQGRHGEVAASAEAAVAEHPLRERLWAQLMVSLYKSGRQAEALRAYQRLRSKLGEELGIEPSSELVALDEAILLQKPDLELGRSSDRSRFFDREAATVDSAARMPIPQRLAVDAQNPFVGREEELRLLESQWKQAREGSRRIVLVSGEPGIGKTSVARALTDKIAPEGASVLYGRCDPDLGIPYQPWREALTHLIDHATPRLAKLITERAPILGMLGLGPEAYGRVSAIPDAEIYILFGAILEILAAAADSEGLLLVLDDVHGADVQSIQLLRRLAVGTQEMRILVVVTVRDSEVSSGSSLARLLADLRSEPEVVRLGLKGLGDLELLSLLEAQAGHELPESGLVLRDALLAETDGNPFFVGELLRHLAETGALYQDFDGHWASEPEVVLNSMPASLSEVIGERVGRLGDAGAHTLSVASVVGREFELGVLAAATESDAATLLDQLDSAIAASLVTDLGDGRFSFTHALIERALYNRLSPTRRAFVHLRVARAIEQESSDDPRRAAELARHWIKATIPQDVHKAFTYAKRAADHALARLAPDEARRWYSEALGLLEHQAVSDERMLCELLVGLGDAERQCGDPNHRATLIRAARSAIDLGEPDLLLHAALANTRGFFAEAGHVDTDRVDILQAAASRHEGRDERRARVLALLAAELTFGGDHRSRMRIADEALSIARDVGDPATLLAVLTQRIAAVQTPDNLAGLLESSGEAVSLAELVNDPILKGFAAGWRYFVSWQSVNRQEADVMWQIMEDSATRLGQPTLRWLVCFLDAHRAMVRADFDETDRLASNALQIGMEIGQPDAFNIYGAQVLRLARERDSAASFLPLLEQVLEQNPQDNTARTMLARLYCDGERFDEARACINKYVEEDFTNVPWDVFWITCLATLADTVADLVWYEAAERLLPLLEPYARQWDWVGPSSHGPVARPCARLASVLGDIERSEAYFESSLAVSQEFDSPLHVAHTHLDWGRAISSRPGPGQERVVKEHLERATQLAEPYGLVLVGRLAGEQRATMGDGNG